MFAEDFVKLLEGADQRLEDASFTDPLEDAADQFGLEVTKNFERQEDSSGQPWLPHSPKTIRLHGEHPLLRLTWTMYAAAIDPNDSNSKKIVQPREVVFGIDGTKVPYAKRQNEGGGRVPQREFFYLTKDGEGEVKDVLAESAFVIIDGEVLAW